MVQGDQVKDVAGQTDKGSDEHYGGVNAFFAMVNYSLGGLHAQPDNHHPDDEDTGQCSKHLSSVVAPGLAEVGVLLSNPDGDHTDNESSNIGQHVSCVCQNSQGVREEASDDFDDHEDEADSDDPSQLAKSLLTLH